MKNYEQKEVDIGAMLKVLGKRWLSLILAFVVMFVACISVTFLVFFNNKTYGVDLDFYFYKVSNIDKEGNIIIGTPTEYDESTMNLVLQMVASQSFLEAIYCNNGIPVKEESMGEELKKAIDSALVCSEKLDAARELLIETNTKYVKAKKETVVAGTDLDIAQANYNAAYSAYTSALQANATAAGAVGYEPIDLAPLLENVTLTSKLLSNNKENEELGAREKYKVALTNESIAEKEYLDCQQLIIKLNREVLTAKANAMTLLRKQAEYKEFMKDVKESITVSYAKNEKNEEIKSTIRVSIAVDKKIEDNEAFAVSLAEKVREQLPNFVVEKVDYATTYCELTNVLDEVEQINKKDLIMTPIKIGLIGGFLALVVVCLIYLVKEKDAYVVTVTRNDDDDK